MDYRIRRGEQIAQASRITKRGDVWMVPSQSGSGQYAVRLNPDLPTCTCMDYELRAMRCKHIYAVEFSLKRQENADGSTTVIQSTIVTEKIKRPTYKQVWPAYNKAQTNQKELFQQLLADLCKGIKDELPLSEAIFACCFKVYSTVSGRRFMSDLRESTERGYLSRTPHFNSIFNYLENPAVGEIRRTLITEAAKPLKSVELDFACDSSGFMTSRFIRWFDHKYGGERKKAEWVKVHLMCGVKTNVVTAVEIRDKDTGDSPMLPELVSATRRNFNVREVSADKGYSSVDNHEAIAKCGAVPFIAFKNNTTGGVGGLFEKMFHYFSLNREEFLRHYHKRSNVESTFAMIKAKFGDAVRSKTDVAMKNEVLAKVVCHNIVCLIHEMYELGIEPTFWRQAVQANT